MWEEGILKAISVSIELNKGVCVAIYVHAVVSEIQGDGHDTNIHHLLFYKKQNLKNLNVSSAWQDLGDKLD